MNVYSCVSNETQYLYSDLLAIQYNNNRLNRGQLHVVSSRNI